MRATCARRRARRVPSDIDPSSSRPWRVGAHHRGDRWPACGAAGIQGRGPVHPGGSGVSYQSGVAVTAFYNEIDKYAAQWLRNLISAGHIASGIVDERSIVDLDPAELRQYTQCHFFAGIGVWSHALRRAGWPDDRPVWTGSCPCQPFSNAGKGRGHQDERHLWPAWERLIRECRPERIFGEQVASKDGLAWLDLVCTDLEDQGYAVGAVDLCAAGVGAPHIRQRLWFVANAPGPGRGILGRGGRLDAQDQGSHAYLDHDGRVGNSGGQGFPSRERQELPGTRGGDEGRATEQPGRSFWSDCEWVQCRDGKARPVEPGTFPLAHGAPARVGRLRAYGNAINAEAAKALIEAAMT